MKIAIVGAGPRGLSAAERVSSRCLIHTVQVGKFGEQSNLIIY